MQKWTRRSGETREIGLKTRIKQTKRLKNIRGCINWTTAEWEGEREREERRNMNIYRITLFL